MKTPIADIRKEYSKESLALEDLDANPIQQFKKWFEQAVNSEVNEPNAMNLATINENGGVSSRIVLLKDIDEDGLVFFTNYLSDKGNQLAASPKAALNFFWPELERQVRIEGKVEKVATERSDNYFHSRPRASRIGAWVSPQSSEIKTRDYLNERQKEFEKKFENKEVPRPDHWGGYLLKPYLIEFWQGRPSRLHDRALFEYIDSKWQSKRLAP